MLVPIPNSAGLSWGCPDCSGLLHASFKSVIVFWLSIFVSLSLYFNVLRVFQIDNVINSPVDIFGIFALIYSVWPFFFAPVSYHSYSKLFNVTKSSNKPSIIKNWLIMVGAIFGGPIILIITTFPFK